MLDDIIHETKLGLRSLIGDDQEMIARVLSEFLAKSDDLEVVSTHSQESAWTALEECPDIDLVLLDLKMVGMESIACLMEHAEDIKTAIASAYIDSHLLERFFKSGVKGYIVTTPPQRNLPSILFLGKFKQVIFPSPRKAPNSSDNQNKLSRNEVSILRMLSDGATKKYFVNEPRQAETTVKMRMRSIYKNINNKNRVHAAILGLDLV